MSKFRIISFDGGGIRGALSARLLKRLSEKYPILLSSTDLFSGTSTGSLIALALASGKSGMDVDNLYNFYNGKRIFSKSHLSLFRPKYNNRRFKRVLKETFTETLKIKDLKKFVFVPAFSVTGEFVDNWEVVIFNNLPNSKTLDSYVIDAALASSAAPTFFPSHLNFIDGGVANNSPTTSSLLLALNEFDNNYKLSDFRLLSIGTGINPNKLARNTSKWGITQWAFNPFIKQNTPLLSIVGDSMIQMNNFYCTNILGKNYFKLNAILDETINIDDFRAVDYLKSVADAVDLTDVSNFIENYFLND
ncbi:MAG: patatin-like phospholipase family protein [Clostridium sp.]